MYTMGKSETSTEMQPQTLTMQPCSKSRQRLSSQLGENQFSHDFYFMPLDSPLSLIRPLSIKEAYGSRHLLLDLSSPTSALPPTKAAAASTPPGKTQPALTSDPAFPPKPLGLLRLHRDTSTQEDAFKTRIVKVTQLCPALCNPMDYTILGILQARILEWVDFPFSSRSSQPKNGTRASCIADGFFNN